MIEVYDNLPLQQQKERLAHDIKKYTILVVINIITSIIAVPLVWIYLAWQIAVIALVPACVQLFIRLRMLVRLKKEFNSLPNQDTATYREQMPNLPISIRVTKMQSDYKKVKTWSIIIATPVIVLMVIFSFIRYQLAALSSLTLIGMELCFICYMRINLYKTALNDLLSAEYMTRRNQTLVMSPNAYAPAITAAYAIKPKNRVIYWWCFSCVAVIIVAAFCARILLDSLLVFSLISWLIPVVLYICFFLIIKQYDKIFSDLQARERQMIQYAMPRYC